MTTIGVASNCDENDPGRIRNVKEESDRHSL